MSMAEQGSNQVAEIRHQLDGMAQQFAAALPKHIPVERFSRVVMTAIQNTPDLIAKVDRRSLFNAAVRAAQDGLLPDGREGAIVPYKGRAQWMPMVAGLRKKVRNSGEIATWEVQVVYENDEWDYQLGDEPFIRHKPTIGPPGPVIAAYSIATLKTGEKSREVMPVWAIEKVREKSQTKDSGPWVQWYEEMCRKTVARRHSKVLPMSTDLDDLLRRDDELYDFAGEKRDEPAKAVERPRTLAGRLHSLARAAPAGDAGVDEPRETIDPETGEITIIPDAPSDDPRTWSAADAYHYGEEARARGVLRRNAVPPAIRDHETLAPAVLAGWDQGKPGGSAVG